MKKKNNQITITAIIIMVAIIAAIIIWQTRYVSGLAYEKINQGVIPNPVQDGSPWATSTNSDPENGVWEWSMAKKIDETISPTNSRDILKNTMFKMEINHSPVQWEFLCEVIQARLEEAGINIRIIADRDCPSLEVDPSLYGWFNWEIKYSKESEKMGFVPLSQVDQRLKKAQNAKNAEELVQILFRHITWEKDCVRVCPCGYDFVPMPAE